MELIPILALIHTLGAAIGAAYSTFAEVFYLRAAEDGVIDKHERKYLRHQFRGLHIGALIVLLAGIALIVLEYLVPNAPEAVVTSAFWALETLTALIILFGYLLSKRESPWWLASAAIFAGWWMLLLTDLGVFNALSYLAIIMTYILLTFIVAGVFGYVRVWTWQPKQPSGDNT